MIVYIYGGNEKKAEMKRNSKRTEQDGINARIRRRRRRRSKIRRREAYEEAETSKETRVSLI